MMLEAPPTENSQLGVERFLAPRAQTNHKPITGLESVQEHMAPFVGLSDREGEALLLVHFINMGRTNPGIGKILDSWRHGDVDALMRSMRDAYQDFPAFMDRIITSRNRRWIPKIEGFIKSGQTYFVVAGAGHMGGSEGVVALLRARGYTVEQWYSMHLRCHEPHPPPGRGGLRFVGRFWHLFSARSAFSYQPGAPPQGSDRMMDQR